MPSQLAGQDWTCLFVYYWDGIFIVYKCFFLNCLFMLAVKLLGCKNFKNIPTFLLRITFQLRATLSSACCAHSHGKTHNFPVAFTRFVSVCVKTNYFLALEDYKIIMKYCILLAIETWARSESTENDTDWIFYFSK